MVSIYLNFYTQPKKWPQLSQKNYKGACFLMSAYFDFSCLLLRLKKKLKPRPGPKLLRLGRSSTGNAPRGLPPELTPELPPELQLLGSSSTSNAPRGLPPELTPELLPPERPKMWSRARANSR